MADARNAHVVPIDDVTDASEVSSSPVGKKVGSGVAAFDGASVSAAVGTSAFVGDFRIRISRHFGIGRCRITDLIDLAISWDQRIARYPCRHGADAAHPDMVRMPSDKHMWPRRRDLSRTPRID